MFVFIFSTWTHLLKSFLSVANRHADPIHSITPEEEPFLPFDPFILLTSDNEEQEQQEEEEAEEFSCDTSTAADKAQT